MSVEMGGANAKVSLQPCKEDEDDVGMPTAREDNTLSDEKILNSGESLLSRQQSDTADEPADNQYFFEDEVFFIDRKGRARFGLVIETSDSFSDDEDEDYGELLQKGQVRVAWYPDGKENIYSDGDLGLVDRTLMPGDVVKRFLPGSDKPQHGYCRNINMRTDVKVLGTKYIIPNIDASRLRLITVFQRDNAVCLDSWVGSTKEVEERAVLRLPSGCRFEISSSDFYCFKDPKTRYMQGIYNPQIFYPGNVLTGRLPSLDNVKLLTPNIPFNRNRKGKVTSSKITVEEVYTDSVWVHWQCKALSEEPNGSPSALQNPQSYISGDDLKRLKRLNLFEACMLQINDRGFLTFEETDKLITKTQWDEEQTAKYKIIFNEQRADRKQASAKSHDSNKLKKKVIANETEKSCKSKKILLKVEKTNNSKEKSTNTDNSLLEQKVPKKLLATNEDVGWVSEEGEPSDNSGDSLIDVEAAASSTNSAGSSSSSRSSPRRISDRPRKARTLKKKWCKPPTAESTPKIGDVLVAESILVHSTATVVWQDGSIEENIPSTALYPLHHLDNHEFFPGDLVVSRKDETDLLNFRDYGVIQTVSHEDRIARVKWFTTYTSSENPQPTYKCETEISVYDLKDHPDFQYRPGTMVIRVANFVGEDANCTAGQVVDSFTDGRIQVWWVDGHASLCWPQDLFEVGQHDQVDFNQESDEESWETQSDDSAVSSTSIATESDTLLNIEAARDAISRLENIFRISPSLQSIDGLIERVRKHENSEVCQDCNNRLPPKSTQKPTCQIQAIIAVNSTQKSQSPHSSAAADSNATSKEYAPKVLFNIASHAHKGFPSSSSMTVVGLNTPRKASAGNASPKIEKYEDNKMAPQTKSLINLPQPQASERGHTKPRCSSVPPVASQEKQNSYNAQKIELLSSAILNIEKAYAHTTLIKWNNQKTDSGTDCKNNENLPTSASTPTQPSGLLPNVNEPNQFRNLEVEDDIAPELMCVRLCSVLKVQLRNCFEEISQKFYSKRQKKNKSKNKDETNAEEAQPEHCAEERKSATESIPEKMMDCSVMEPPDFLDSEYFQIISNAPRSHKFYATAIEPANPKNYVKSIQREHYMLQSSLPPGAWVRVFEDRLDLMSVMLLGPKNTPYEDGIFLFDLQMGREYPRNPPTCHYISFCTDRLNPNLYEDGKVCVSLLGTWSGRDTEVWCPNSTILQVIVSIQGLILVPEPYFNEAGYEKQKGSLQGQENSRMYNEMAIIKMVQATTKLLEHPVELYRREILIHFKRRGQAMYDRIKEWVEMSAKETANDLAKNVAAPDFPLIPASKGFCLTLSNILCTFKAKLEALKEVAITNAENLNY